MANIYTDEKGTYVSMIGEEKEKEMAQRYLKGEKSSDLAKEYGYKGTESVLAKVHKYFPDATPKNGYCQINSKEIEKQIADEYINSNIPIKDLMKKYGYKTRKSITDKVKKYYPNYDVKSNSRERIKDYHLDFTKIDTEFKTYFLGLMYTDGYLVDEKRFGIDLVDEDCIAFISRNTGHGYKKYYDIPGRTFFGKVVNRKPKYRIIFSSEKNIKQLKYWGLFNNKTYSLVGCNLNEINPYFYPYILRGIIDGDGWITPIKQGIGTFGVVSASLDFINWINQLCELIGMKDMRISSYMPEYGKVELYKIVTSKKDNMKILHDIVYDESFGMRRKRNKLKKMFRDYNKSATNS